MILVVWFIGIVTKSNTVGYQDVWFGVRCLWGPGLGRGIGRGNGQCLGIGVCCCRFCFLFGCTTEEPEDGRDSGGGGSDRDTSYSSPYQSSSTTVSAMIVRGVMAIMMIIIIAVKMKSLLPKILSIRIIHIPGIRKDDDRSPLWCGFFIDLMTTMTGTMTDDRNRYGP